MTPRSRLICIVRFRSASECVTDVTRERPKRQNASDKTPEGRKCVGLRQDRTQDSALKMEESMLENPERESGLARKFDVALAVKVNSVPP